VILIVLNAAVMATLPHTAMRVVIAAGVVLITRPNVSSVITVMVGDTGLWRLTFQPMINLIK